MNTVGIWVVIVWAAAFLLLALAASQLPGGAP